MVACDIYISRYSELSLYLFTSASAEREVPSQPLTSWARIIIIYKLKSGHAIKFQSFLWGVIIIPHPYLKLQWR